MSDGTGAYSDCEVGEFVMEGGMELAEMSQAAQIANRLPRDLEIGGCFLVGT